MAALFNTSHLSGHAFYLNGSMKITAENMRHDEKDGTTVKKVKKVKKVVKGNQGESLWFTHTF